MKSLLLMLAFNYCITGAGLAQIAAAHLPHPPYPPAAFEAKVAGSGTCRVVFNASGGVETAVMTKSTGSKILDDNTISYARHHWTGPPNDAVVVPITYELPTLTPPAPYPYQAVAAHLQGSGSVTVVFDASGKAISAKMDKSTGSDILDDNTIKYALANWRSASGKKETKSIPVYYQLR